MQLEVLTAVCETVYGREGRQVTQRRLRSHVRNPTKSPITESTITAFMKKISESIDQILDTDNDPDNSQN